MKFTRKFLNIIVASIITTICFNFANTINAKIPEYKGLYTLFVPDEDTIGIGQSLYYSRYIENKSTYAPKGDLAKEVIDIFWFKRTENDNFLLTKKSPGSDITPEVLGLLLKYVTEFKESEKNKAEKNKAEKERIAELWFEVCSEKYKKKIDSAEQELAGLPGKIKKLAAAKDSLEKEMKNAKTKPDKKVKTEEIKIISQDLKKKIDQLRDMPKAVENLKNKEEGINKYFNEKIRSAIEALEKLKANNKQFIPETAAAILWAVFESNLDWAEKEFEICLNQINPTLFGKLKSKYNKADYDALDKKFEKKEKIIIAATEQIRDKNIHEELTYYIIKTAKTKNIPNKIEQGTGIVKDLTTGAVIDTFPTCFESVILDLISMLIYNRDTREYDLGMLPNEVVRDNKSFEALIDKVFKKDGSWIESENVYEKLQIWIDLVTNLKELEYFNNKKEVRYDLKPGLENLVQALNKFLNLGFKITDMRDNLKIKDKASKEIDVKKDDIDSWQVLFDAISEKLSTPKRIIKFELEKEEIDGIKFKKISLDSTSRCIGVLKISIGETNLQMVMAKGHAKNICVERDQSRLAGEELVYLKIWFMRSIYKAKCLVPLFMFLPAYGLVVIVGEHTPIEELVYYSFNLKDLNVKIWFLGEVLFRAPDAKIKLLYENSSFQGLISSLIDKLPSNDIAFMRILIDYLRKYKDGENKLYWRDEVVKKIKNVIEKSNAELNSAILLEIFKVSNLLNWSDLRNWLEKASIIEIVKMLLKDTKINVNAKNIQNQTPLQIALVSGSTGIADIILNNAKIDIYAEDSNGNTCLHLAARDEKNIEIVKKFLEDQKIDVNAKNGLKETPLHVALNSGSAEIADMLLNNAKIDIYAEDSNENTCLHSAARDEKNIEIVKKFLKDPKIDVNAKNGLKETPLHIALVFGSAGIADMLLKDQKIDINARDLYGNTYLHLAARDEKNIEIVKKLLEDAKIDINATNKYKETPLHIAVYNYNTGIVKKLLKDPKIDIYAKDSHGKTAKYIANIRGFAEIIKLIEQREKLDKEKKKVSEKKLVGKKLSVRELVEKHNQEIKNVKESAQSLPKDKQ